MHWQNHSIVQFYMNYFTKISIYFQLDAAWALTNIACGDKTETHVIVRAGAVRPLLEIASRVDWTGLVN